MTRILAVDPGSTQSAWLYLDPTQQPRLWAIEPNDVVLERLRAGSFVGLQPDVVVIEWVESYGMAVGREVFATVHWSGRFTEAARPTPVEQLPRLAVKKAICHDGHAKDPNIRQALIDRYGGPTAIGRKGSEGPLYGISKDVWSALALAVTWAETGAPA